MFNRIADLRCKEVINICDGLRLGFISDVHVNTATGQIEALVVPGPCRFGGFLGREDDYVIPWECIRKIGDDIILTEIPREYKREKHAGRFWI